MLVCGCSRSAQWNAVADQPGLFLAALWAAMVVLVASRGKTWASSRKASSLRQVAVAVFLQLVGQSSIYPPHMECRAAVLSPAV